ncbi:MAG: adventurous gliding motility protein GltC [Deltaproteobacteria bacterium]|nr:adventurous gliding motility protein GltC [Deltaproteobacteria bacterium]
MRQALLTAAVTVALLVPRLSSAQINFDGLDLSGDDSSKKKSTKKKPVGESAKKKSPKKSVDDTPAPTPAPDPAKSGTSTTTAPATDPGKPGTSSGMGFEGLDLNKPNGGGDPSSTGAAPAKPPEPPKKAGPAPVMSFDAVDVSGKSAERQRLDAAIKLFKEESYETASLAFSEVLNDPKMVGLHDEAQYNLAKTLYRLKLYHSSLNHFKALLSKGPSNKFFKSGLEWLFFIAHKTVNEQIVLDEVAKWANQEFPERFRAEFRYLLSRYHFARGKALDEVGQADEAKKSFEEARKLLVAVPKSDPFYAKAKYLEGTIFFKDGNFAPSLESFKEVVRANNPRVNSNADIRLRELAFMQLARTHYGHRQNRFAIFYYDKVQPGSDQWLEALFEESWAHFRIGNYERALGNLITLSAPFFKDEYFPEALILKAVVYFENCRYREARAILEEFEETYMPVHNELEKITSQTSDAQRYYDILAEIQKRNKEGGKGSTLLLERILKLALTDKDLKLVNDSILEVEREMDTIGEARDLFRYSDLSKGLGEGLKGERQQLINRAGLLAKAKLEYELGQLKELLGNALRIKFETSTREKEVLETLMREGTVKKEELSAYNVTTAVNDERVYWPYEGEYWRDELGTYEYTLTKGCKAKK